ncbi:MAG: sigma-70 family RNA polymerase sigma factor [Burkholderiaceae bacterium]|jgi:RNA polymerase sigma-70 factor (ECF subfamily)|nr:sigma-70 family RNA polymerase sigma factor [Burkholderiaceae bacterium]
MNATETDHGSTNVLDEARELASLRATLVRQARRLVADRHRAEDLVQDTLLAVLRGQAERRGEASLSTWAVAILRHKAADWYRSAEYATAQQSRDFDGSTGDFDGDDSSQGASERFGGAASSFAQPDRVLEQRELAAAIAECVARLSARSRQAFTMREQLGFDTDEVSRRLAISQDHCRTLLHRARLALRALLAAKSHVPGGMANALSRFDGAARLTH